MNSIELRKCLADEYFKYAMDLCIKNGKVDDYDIRVTSGKEYEEIAPFKLSILNLVSDLYRDHPNSKIGCYTKNNRISLNLDDGHPLNTFRYDFQLLLTNQMTFSGTIGITDIEYDGGLTKHLNYLSLFFDKSDIRILQSILINHHSEESIIRSYTRFYEKLVEIIQNNPTSAYRLFTGVKQAYDIPDTAVLLTDSGHYKIIDFNKLNSHSFLNSSESFEYTASDISPYLKVEYEGNKILHIRTKTDTKNNKFKLRFFIETNSKFLQLFEKE